MKERLEEMKQEFAGFSTINHPETVSANWLSMTNSLSIKESLWIIKMLLHLNKKKIQKNGY